MTSWSLTVIPELDRTSRSPRSLWCIPVAGQELLFALHLNLLEALLARELPLAKVFSSCRVDCGPMAAPSHSEKLHVQSTFVWFELERPCHLHAIWCSNRVVVCTFTIHQRVPRRCLDFLPEWCNHSSTALARPSLERCSSVHASAAPLDSCCRVLDQPANVS